MIKLLRAVLFAFMGLGLAACGLITPTSETSPTAQPAADAATRTPFRANPTAKPNSSATTGTSPSADPTTQPKIPAATRTPPSAPLPPGIVAAPIQSDTWINVDQPIAWDSLRGKVVLVEFWTFGCVNCQNVIAPLRQMYADYKSRGFTIISVHSPEFSYEKDADNVRNAVKQGDIQYPVALDNDFANWKRYSNLYWPAFYLVDQQGFIRYRHAGEGAYDTTRAWIEYLLNE